MDQSNSVSTGLGLSTGVATWQTEWIDAVWEQLVTGTFTGIGNVVVDGAIAQTEAQIQADLSTIDQMLLGNRGASELLSEVQSFAQNNSFDLGIDSLTGSLPAVKAVQSLAQVLQQVYEQSLPTPLEANQSATTEIADYPAINAAAADLSTTETPNAQAAHLATPVAARLTAFEADATANCILPFTVVAEGRVTVNGNSDFDGDPLRPEDDALIYGGRGFTLNGRPILPVQRDENGNPILNDQGRPIVVQNAVAVSANYSTINAPNNQYGQLVPPQIVDTQTVTVPGHSAFVTATLSQQIPAGAVPVVFNRQNKPLNNASDWQRNFPPGGTANNPAVIRITSGGLNIPSQVVLENTILLVENGDVNFNGSGHQLNNVTLVTYNGGVNLSNVVGTNLTVMSSRQINMNGGAKFNGQSLLASQNSVTFNGTTTSGTDRLKVVSQGNITFNGSSNTRAQFLAAGNFSFNGNATLYGRIAVKGDITFNSQATVFAANDAPIVGANRTLVIAEDSGAVALNIELPVDRDGDEISIRVNAAPDADKGAVLLANGSAVSVGQRLTLGELQGLVFVPVADANGAAGSFSYVAEDGWCQPASQRVTLQITPVNDGPVITAPAALTLAANTTLSFASSLQLQDIDAGELPLQITLAVSHGLLQLGESATTTGSSLVLSGSLSELNAQLNEIQYRPTANYAGDDALTIVVTDQGNTGAGGALTDSATVELTVTPASVGPIIVTLALQTDTGSNSADGITSVATITGNVSDAARVARLSAGFGNTPTAEYFDISQYLQNGTFVLDAPALAAILGQPLTDGSYLLNVIAEDILGTVSQPISYSYTLDATSPALSLISPISGGAHSEYVHLIGSVNEAVTIQTTLENNEAVSFSADSAGEFDQLLQTLPLTAGAHQLAVTLTDVAGNAVQTTVNFEVSDTAFVTGPTQTQGWAISTADTIVLGESNSYVVQATLPVTLGQSEGSRTLRFAVNAAFDTADQGAINEDRFALYLVDPANPQQTLLDNGTPGTPLFALEGGTAEFTPGLVRYDGQYVEIDLTELGDRAEGLLVFQFLNQDNDTGGRVSVSGLTNEVDLEGTAGLRFPTDTSLANLGGELDLSALSASTTVKALFSNIRFNADTGEYTAELRLRNTGEESISRQAAVVFANLPEGVSLVTASGVGADGNGYLNLREAIRPGGLQRGAISDAVAVTFSNPDQIRMALSPTVLVGGPNQSPLFPELGPLTVMPGQKLEIPLGATDPDGDRVTYSIRSNGDLPKGKLNGSGKLVFEPRPDQIGTYEFTLVATDGAAETTQQISLTVAPDPDTTTRITGQILDTEGNPLANLPLALGRLQAVTDPDGYFTLAVPPTSFPTERINIEIPFGDAAFDPFFTGTSEIDLRRTTFDGATGTSLSNPLRHPNLVTTFLDANMVYGSDANRAAALRTNDGTGRLKVSDGDLLPINNSTFFPDGTLTNDNRGLTDPATLFATGDVRANENIALTAVHTVFLREHNRLADEIKAANPDLGGEEIYQRARKLVAAQIQYITYSEYLPLLVGDRTIADYSGYDANVDPSISHLFSAAAFRMGHTQSFDEFLLIGDDGQALPPVSLDQSTFNPALVQQYGVDAILRGLFAQSTQAIDTKVIGELRNTLFGPPGSGGIDLAAVDIQRGRDVGLPDYNQARVDFGLAPVTSFAEITSDVALQAVLAQVYGDVNEIDAIVGGLAEDAVAGSMVGKFFQTVIADQFARLRDGDRFWYENGQFTNEELSFIRGTSLSALLARNTEITGLANNVFSTGRDPVALGQGGTVATQTVTEYAALDGSNNNLGNSKLGTPGTNLRVDYTQEYGDGIRTLAGEGRANVRDISNAIFTQDESIPDASGATGFMLAWSQFLGHDMTLSPAGAADTLKVYGTQYESAAGEVFPFIAEKLNLLLGHEVYAGVNNVIDRPIYLPALAIDDNVQTVDNNGDITVANANLNAQVFVSANSLTDNRGNPFEGTLTISEVPPELTPAALPKNLFPDLVVTIQPGEMVFTGPARLTLPNRAGWSSGSEMDLWSINPTTGDFEIVGKGRVSEDGKLIETVEGGIRNSSWHFFSTVPGAIGGLGADDPRNPDHGCQSQGETEDFSSQVELASGGVIEKHDLVTYSSLGSQKGLTLTYDSLRADPSPIIHFSVDIPPAVSGGGNGSVNNEFRLISKLSLRNGDFEYQAPGFEGGKYGLEGGENFWNLPSITGGNSIAGDPALQVNLKDLTSGKYLYTLDAGVYAYVDERFTGTSRSIENSIIHVNSTDSLFGSGWGISGVQELVENEDGSVLIIDGDGTEVLFEMRGSGYTSPVGDFSTLTRLANGSFTRTYKDQTKHRFEDNRLVSIVDRNGNETRHSYNLQGQITAIIDPVGLATRFEYTAGKVSKIIDPANRETKLTYDAQGNLLSIKDPDSSERQFQYDSAGHMLGETNQRGYQENATYDFAGRAKESTRKDGSSIRLKPIQVEGLLKSEATIDPFSAPSLPRKNSNETPEIGYADANGNVKITAVEKDGLQAATIRDSIGIKYELERNTNNLISQVSTGRGKLTNFKYDDNGNVIQVKDEISTVAFELGENPPQNVDSVKRLFPGRLYTPSSNQFILDSIQADLNNDGYLDIATVSDNVNVDVFYGDGKGDFAGTHSFSTSGYGVIEIASSDFDQDGKEDLAVLAEGSPYSGGRILTILFGNSAGVFSDTSDFGQDSVSFDVGVGRFGLNVADLDNDTYKDILISSGRENSYVLFNNQSVENRSFVESAIGEGFDGYIEQSAVADINGDGSLDIIKSDNSSVSILLNEGNRTFSTLSSTFTGSYSFNIQSEDINKDGFSDILISDPIENKITFIFGDALASLNTSQEYNVDGSPSVLAISDINRDGNLDVVSANVENDTVSILLATEGGSWQVAESYSIGNYSSASSYLNNTSVATISNSIRVADVNGDEYDDIVVVNSGDDSLSILLNRQDNTFSDQVAYPVGFGPISTFLESNSSGQSNIVVINSGKSDEDFRRNPSLSVLKYRGNNTFTNATSNVPAIPTTVVSIEDGVTLGSSRIVDFNGDGREDIIGITRKYNSSTRRTESSVGIAFNNGDSSFSPMSDVAFSLYANGSINDVLVDDFNNDSLPDLLISESFFNSRQLTTWLSDETGGFSSPRTTSLSNTVLNINSGDFNGDGIQDLIYINASNRTAGELKILIGDGDGSYLENLSINTVAYVDDIRVLDIDGDGLDDIVFLNEGNDPSQPASLSTLLNKGNQTFQLVSHLISLQEGDSIGFYSPLNFGDINGDGDLDVIFNVQISSSDGSSRSYLETYIGDVDGGFTAKERYLLATGFTSDVEVEDFNQDGFSDILLTEYGNYGLALSLLLNAGDGTFNPKSPNLYQDYSISKQNYGGYTTSTRSLHFDSDSAPDLLFYEQNVGFSVLRNLLFDENSVEDGSSDDNGLKQRQDGKFFTYDTIFNQLTSITDELNHKTLFEIDPSNGNRLSMRQVIGSVGGEDDILTTFTYTNHGQISTSTDDLGRVSEYSYNELGQLFKTTYAKGTNLEASEHFEYDTYGNIAASINANGQRTEYIYDVMNRLVQLTETDPDEEGVLTSPVTSYGYDKSGNLLSVIDARGNLLSYEYDKMDRKIKSVDAQNRETLYTYDKAGNLSTVVDALGQTESYLYDSRNRLILKTDAEGHKTRYRYDLDDNLSLVQDALGNRTTNSYDARNRLITVRDSDGRQTLYGYDELDNLTKVTDRNGNVTRYKYDDLYRSVEVTDSLGNTFTTEYDEVGNVAASIDGRGNTASFEYDERNRLIQNIDALGGDARFSYDDFGNLLSVTDELNRTVRYEYDGLNRQTKATDPLSHDTRYSYDDFGNLIEVEDALSRKTRFQYDELNRQTKVVDPNNRAVTTKYDAVGNIASVTDQIGRTTRFSYDKRNLQTGVIDPLGHTTTAQYDEVGNIVRVADALGHATQYSYDSLYRQTKVTDALGKETSMAYDAEGNLLSLTDASGNITSYAYDKGDRIQTETITVDGEALTRSYDYDAVDNLIEMTDRNGRIQRYTYDALNRRTQEDWLGTSGNILRTVNSTYDAASQLTAIIDPDSSYSYAYDAAGRLITADNIGTAGVPNVRLSYGYDAVNNLTSVSDRIAGVQKGVERFDYDVLNRVKRITQSGSGVAEKRVDLSYDAASQMTGLQRYRDLAGTQAVVNTAYTHDAAGRLTGLSHLRSNDSLADYRLSYDSANRLTQLVTPDGTSNYSYNQRDELTGSDHSYQADEGYSYDDTGNRTNSGYVTGDHNRLFADGTYRYEYDDEGNRTRRTEIATGAVTEYGWDTRNRLTQVLTKDSAGAVVKAVEYTYDAYNQRIAKSVDSDGDGLAAATEERYVYDGDHIALVFDGQGNQLSRYLHGPQIDQVLAEETAEGEVRWALTDHQGSVRDVIDDAGNVLNHLTYDSYGQITSETNPEVDFRFGYTGRERDEETGLYYYRARYFDPAVGTFVSADPLGFGAGDSNLYSYVSNSPTNFTDPSGENAVGNGINRVLANNTVYNTLNRADQFAAGFGSGATFGATNRIRSTVYGANATRNHSGLLYTAGNITGDLATSVVLTGATAPRRVRQAWTAVDTARTVIDVGRSANNIYQDIRNECTNSAGSLSDYLTIGGAVIGVGVNARRARNLADGAGDVSRPISQLRSGVLDSSDDLTIAANRANSSQSTVFSGHGNFHAGNGVTSIPEGTSLEVYSRFGSSITDSLGNAIETGAALPEGLYRRTYNAGDRIPNYTLSSPNGLAIQGSPTTVNKPTNLTELLQPGMGHCQWAACTYNQSARRANEVYTPTGVKISGGKSWKYITVYE